MWRRESMKDFGRRLLAILWGILTLEVRSPDFLAHAPIFVKRLEAVVRGNAE
jgi:hypothetical protein